MPASRSSPRRISPAPGMTPTLSWASSNYDPCRSHATPSPGSTGSGLAPSVTRTSCASCCFPPPDCSTPTTVYLRALLELHEPEPDDPHRPTRLTGLSSRRFQRDGYERARAILPPPRRRDLRRRRRHRQDRDRPRVHRGVRTQRGRRLRAGHHAPRSSPSAGDERIDQAKLPAQVISFQELAADEQLAARSRASPSPLNNAKDSTG